MFDAVTIFARICAYGLLQLRVRERPLRGAGWTRGELDWHITELVLLVEFANEKERKGNRKK
jgi:hypothetical protein